MTKPKSVSLPYALALTIIGICARLMPHPSNFAPVGGESLFSGARVNAWYAFLVPIAIMAITDPFLGGYSTATPFIYASFLLSVLIGRSLRHTTNPVWIGMAALACSVQFFVISNFAYFWFYFPHTLSGLTVCYMSAIPFFPATLVGDLATSGVLFTVHYLLSRMIAPQERALAHQ